MDGENGKRQHLKLNTTGLREESSECQPLYGKPFASIYIMGRGIKKNKDTPFYLSTVIQL